MSLQSFNDFVAGLSEDPVEAAALRASLGNAEDLARYAAAKGHPLTVDEAQTFVAEAANRAAGGAEPLSDQSLDQVSGAGWKQNHFS